MYEIQLVNTNIHYTPHCIEVKMENKYGQLEYELGQHCHSDWIYMLLFGNNQVN